MGWNKNKLGDTVAAFFLNNKVVVIVILLAIPLSIASPIFLTLNNVLNVLRQVSISTIVALGFTLIMGAGDIDLSVGSIVGLVGVVMGKLMMEMNFPIYIVIPCGILTGAVCGMLNAVIMSAFTLPSFIVTLATASLFRGMMYIMTNMVPITELPKNFVNIGQGYAGPIPIPIIVMLLTAVVIFIIANRTRFGRYVVAMGGNKEATRVCGINVRNVRVGVFLISGITSAIAGIIMTARTASAQISSGVNMEMDVIAAVVIGGTPLTGGTMNVVGTLFGCLLVGMINNGLNLLGVNSNYQIIAKGMLILLALIIDVMSSRFYEDFKKKQTLQNK